MADWTDSIRNWASHAVAEWGWLMNCRVCGEILCHCLWPVIYRYDRHRQGRTLVGRTAVVLLHSISMYLNHKTVSVTLAGALCNTVGDVDCHVLCGDYHILWLDCDRAVWHWCSSQRAAASSSESTVDDKHAASTVCSGNVTVNVIEPITCSTSES